MVGWLEDHLACKKSVGILVVTGVLHVLELQYVPLPPPSSFAALISRIVCHSDAGLLQLSWHTVYMYFLILKLHGLPSM